MKDEDFYRREFTCGESIVSRDELESLPCPFCMANVSDETMQEIIDNTDRSTKERLHLSANKPLNFQNEKVSEIWWEELEAAVTGAGVPYCEDMETD